MECTKLNPLLEAMESVPALVFVFITPNYQNSSSKVILFEQTQVGSTLLIIGAIYVYSAESTDPKYGIGPYIGGECGGVLAINCRVSYL